MTSNAKPKAIQELLRAPLPISIALVIYSLLILAIIPKHEPWFDEAQAWLMARDLSPYDLAVHYARYEGTPILWHLILMLPAKVGMPYSSLNYISGFFSIFAVLMLLFRTKLPLLIKVLLPFTYFFAFQYSVVSRSYCLLAPLLVLVAINYTEKIQKCNRFTAFLVLLSNVSVHGLLIASAIYFSHIFDLWRKWKTIGAKKRSENAKATFLFVLNIVFIGIQLIPPPDITFAVGNRFDLNYFFRKSTDIFVSAYGSNSLLACFVLIASCVWFYRNGVLFVYLLTNVLLLSLFSVKYFNYWHEGTLFLTWVFTLVLSFQIQRTRSYPFERKLVVAAALLMFVPYIYWSGCAIRFDWFNAYSGSREIARYIKENGIEKQRIAATGFLSHSILPYFDENIFINSNNGRRPAFWLWSSQAQHWETDAMINKEKPDYVIIGLKYSRGLDYRPIPGYKFVKAFQGDIFWKYVRLENDSFILLKKAE